MTLDSHALGILYATTASLAWVAFSFTMKTALTDAPVLRAAAAVNGLNACFVTIIALFLVPPAAFVPARPEALIYLFLAGVLHIGLARIFFYTAIQRLGPNRAVPLAMSYPIVTAVTAAFALGESVSLQIFAGLLLLLAGITLIVRAAPSHEIRKAPSASWKLLGWACAGVTSLLWGVAAVFFKKAALEIPPIAVAAGVLWVGFGVTFAISRAMEPGKSLSARMLRWLAVMQRFTRRGPRDVTHYPGAQNLMGDFPSRSYKEGFPSGSAAKEQAFLMEFSNRFPLPTQLESWRVVRPKRSVISAAISLLRGTLDTKTHPEIATGDDGVPLPMSLANTLYSLDSRETSSSWNESTCSWPLLAPCGTVNTSMADQLRARKSRLRFAKCRSSWSTGSLRTFAERIRPSQG